MRTTLIFIISYFFGDVVNPIYLFISLYALSFIGLYFFWKWKKSKKINTFAERGAKNESDIN